MWYIKLSSAQLLIHWEAINKKGYLLIACCTFSVLTYNAEVSLPTLYIKETSYAMIFKYQVVFPNVFTPIKKNIDLLPDSSSSDERHINNFVKHWQKPNSYIFCFVLFHCVMIDMILLSCWEFVYDKVSTDNLNQFYSHVVYILNQE